MIEDDDFFFSETKAPFEESVLSVSALLSRLQNTLTADFSDVHVLGEVHSFHPSTSGHWYIDLKDEKKEALIQLCFFRNARRANSYEPKVGDLVEVRGRLQLYEPQGKLSLIVFSLQPAGEGLLYAKFMALKTRLEADGYFDSSRKKPIPLYPKRVGIITSEKGAALRDVVKTISLHAPNIALTLYPVTVQGEGAEKEIIRALKVADDRHEVDCLLLVRGGGSLSDLWTFNSEELAYAISRTKLPIISGVGHETDTTIADFVADLRAATPTAAAMAVASGWEKGALTFEGLLRRLATSKDAKLRELQSNLRVCDQPKRLMKQLLVHFKDEHERIHQKLLRATDDVFEAKKNQLTLLLARLRSAKPSSGVAQERYKQLRVRFIRAAKKEVEGKRERLSSLLLRLKKPSSGLAQEQLKKLVMRLTQASKKNFEEKGNRIKECKTRLVWLRPDTEGNRRELEGIVNRIESSFKHGFEKKSVSLTALYARLQSLDVNRVLERGFCLVQDEKGHVYTGIEQLAVGSDVEMVFSQGKALANVKQISQKK